MKPLPPAKTYDELLQNRDQQYLPIPQDTINHTQRQASQTLRRQLDQDVQNIRNRVVQDLNLQASHWAAKMDQALNSVIDRAIEKGDPQALSTVWDRLIGKPTERLEIDVERQHGVETLLQKLETQYGEIVNAEITEKISDSRSQDSDPESHGHS